jgi:hypothetical protein
MPCLTNSRLFISCCLVVEHFSHMLQKKTGHDTETNNVLFQFWHIFLYWDDGRSSEATIGGRGGGAAPNFAC